MLARVLCFLLEMEDVSVCTQEHHLLELVFLGTS